MRSLFGGIRSAVSRTSGSLPVSLAPRGRLTFGSIIRHNDQEAQMSALGSVGTLFAIVHRISTAVGQVDWHLYRRAKSGMEADRVEVTSHAALDLWNQPNKFYTQNEFIETHQQFSDLTGEAWWVMQLSGGDRGFPLSIWPIRPDKMTPIPDPKDYVSGYYYSGPDGERVPLNVNQVIQHKLPNPLDPYRGLGPVQALLVDLDATRYAAEWNRNFFLNSAAPGGIIEIERRLADDEFRELSQRWTEQHQGIAQAHRVAILEQAKWVDRNYTMKDMQFAELRSVSRDTIMEAFGMGRPMLGITEDVNRANADAAEYVFSKYLTVSRLERIKMALNHRLLPMYGPSAADLEFDYDSPVAEDQETANATLATAALAALNLVNAGYDPDAVLETVGLPEMDYVGKPASAAPPALAPAPEPEPDADDEPLTNSRRRTVRAQAGDQDTEPPNDVDLSHVEDALDAALAKVLGSWTAIRRAQIEDLVNQVRSVVESGDLDRLADIRPDTADAAKVLRTAMTAIGDVGAQQMAQELRAQGLDDVNPESPDADGIALRASATAATLGTALGLSAARSALAHYADDADADDVAAAVGTDLGALTMAQPEESIGGALMGAMNFGRLGTLKSTPDAAMYASEVLDRNTCKACRAVDGMWLGNTDGTDFSEIDRMYPNGQYVGCAGGSRCRGTVVGVSRPDQTTESG